MSAQDDTLKLADKKNAVDALYALGVGANLRPEDQVNLIHDVIRAVLSVVVVETKNPETEKKVNWRSVTERGSFDSKGRFYIHYGEGSRKHTRDIGETPWVEVQS